MNSPTDCILDFQNVTKQFPGVIALKDVSLQIRRGSIHGFCGENGAGKSTLMKILAGVYPHGTYEGSILFDGAELRLETGAILKAREQGIAIVYQELTLVPQMTVGENVYLGKEFRHGNRINWEHLYKETEDLLARYQLDIDPRAKVKSLGVGQMQMVEIAKALAQKAQVLILDEPTSALSENEVQKLMKIIGILKSHGVTCLYITHKLDEFFQITDDVTVMRDGKVITSGPTAELTKEKLVSLMVGRKMTDRFPPKTSRAGEVFFRVAGLTANDPAHTGKQVLKGVSFDLRRGEILGIAGLMGSGRTELVTTLFGEFGKVTGGSVELDGKEVKITSSREAMAEGLALVPEDRKVQGLVLAQSILKNMSLPNLNQFSSVLRINKNAELSETLKYFKSLLIKANDAHTVVNTLSGGNQQKVVISKWLMSSPKILILDDPTRGIDVGAKYEIYKLMNQLAAEGMSIIMISSELEEILGMSDRVMVMWAGRSNGTLDIKDATQETIMARATGLVREQGLNP